MTYLLPTCSGIESCRWEHFVANFAGVLDHLQTCARRIETARAPKRLEGGELQEIGLC